MKLICLLFCIGAAVDIQQQYVDCEFIIGLIKWITEPTIPTDERLQRGEGEHVAHGWRQDGACSWVRN